MADTQMLTLTDFLLARIAEDEDAARATIDADFSEGRWVWESYGPDPYRSALMNDRGAVLLPSKHDDVFPSRCIVEHITRHDPARVLAECEAKRRIVEMHRWKPPRGMECDGHPHPYVPHADYGEGYCMYYANRDGEFSGEIRLLALPYADHPDYRDEWRP